MSNVTQFLESMGRGPALDVAAYEPMVGRDQMRCVPDHEGPASE